MRNLSMYVIRSDTPVIEAMSKIDKNAKGIVFICESNYMKATLSDGDIRRHIITGGSLSAPVIEAANKNFVFATMDIGIEGVDRLFNKYKVRCIPKLDNNGCLIDVYFKDEQTYSNSKIALNVPVVIMAGGKGTRLNPYTKILPKPLVPVGNLTITELIMKRFLSFGCSDFTMILNHKRNMIKAYFSDNVMDFNIRFLDEEKPLGTGGGLSLLSGLMESTFFLTNCDIMVFEDYDKILDYHYESQFLLTMVCASKQISIPYGTVAINKKGMITSISEKPKYSFLTNTGFYIINPLFINRIQKNTPIHITQIITKCIDDGESIGIYPISEDKWADMGQIDEMDRMNEMLKTMDEI